MLRIPKKAAKECEAEHGGDFHGDGGTKENEGEDEHPCTVQSSDRWQELLEHAGREGE